jgi:hypothetical protein
MNHALRSLRLYVSLMKPTVVLYFTATSVTRISGY